MNEIETFEWTIEGFGQILGKLKITKDSHQGTITLDLEVKPDSDLEIRTSASNQNSTQFVLAIIKKRSGG